MILYSKRKSMLLNTFYYYFGSKIIFAFSQLQEINMLRQKIAKIHPKFGVVFGEGC